MAMLCLLILEDEPIIEAHLNAFLFKKNWQVLSYESLQDVPAEINQTVDVVLTNMKLESGWVDESGIVKIRRLKARKIVILTGARPVDVQPFMSSVESSTSLLYKPFTTNQLSKVLQPILS